MPSIAQPPALDTRVAALVAESLAPVPRASHSVAVDADDLSLVVRYAAEAAAAARSGRRAPAMSADTEAACRQLKAVTRARAAA